MIKKKQINVSPVSVVISSGSFRKSVFEKGSKKRKSDWQCVYCNKFNSDEKRGNQTKWITCDNCNLKMHVKCLPNDHRNFMELCMESVEEGLGFQCEICLYEN